MFVSDVVVLVCCFYANSYWQNICSFFSFFFNIQMSTFLVMFQFLTEVCFMPTVVSQSTYNKKKTNELQKILICCRSPLKMLLVPMSPPSVNLQSQLNKWWCSHPYSSSVPCPDVSTCVRSSNAQLQSLSWWCGKQKSAGSMTFVEFLKCQYVYFIVGIVAERHQFYVNPMAFS